MGEERGEKEKGEKINRRQGERESKKERSERKSGGRVCEENHRCPS